jgi:hypothetical protein
MYAYEFRKKKYLKKNSMKAQLINFELSRIQPRYAVE